MKQALILFVRPAVLGKVKTRIAAESGDTKALLVYEKLLAHTFAITHQLAVDKFVFYAEEMPTNDIWSSGHFKKRLQEQGDLGQRMQQAFASLFKGGYEQVAIIGSDCYELNARLIEQAFTLLSAYDMVIGPAHDGGYYLLAMRNEVRAVFEAIEWSTPKVLEQTLTAIKKLQLTYTLLPGLHDIDTIHDIPEAWRKELSILLPDNKTY